MKYRKLGCTGLKVSEIGFGAWGIGGPVEDMPAYGLTDDYESSAALWLAYSSGVNFYDTSNVYGRGHSEEIIGQTFEGVRDQVLLATKVGMQSGNGLREFSYDHIQRSLQESLTRLRTNYVDLYQLHGPTISDLEENLDSLSALESLRSNRVIRAFGISVNSPDEAVELITKFDFNCIQVNFNLVDQRASINGLLDLCRKRDVGVIIRTPLCFGFLTGVYSSDIDFPPEDHRSSWSDKQIMIWSKAGKQFANALNARGLEQSEAQVALRYCLSYTSVSTVIPGMLTRNHVSENILASQMGRFSKSELSKIESIYKDNVFFIRDN